MDELIGALAELEVDGKIDPELAAVLTWMVYELKRLDFCVLGLQGGDYD